VGFYEVNYELRFGFGFRGDVCGEDFFNVKVASLLMFSGGSTTTQTIISSLNHLYQGYCPSLFPFPSLSTSPPIPFSFLSYFVCYYHLTNY